VLWIETQNLKSVDILQGVSHTILEHFSPENNSGTPHIFVILLTVSHVIIMNQYTRILRSIVTFLLYQLSAQFVDWYICYDGVRLTNQNCGHYGPTEHPRVIAMWTMVWWYRLELTPNLSARALWQPPVLSGGLVTRDISDASRRMDEGNENLVYPSTWDLKRPLTCRKTLRHGTSGFSCHPKEGVRLKLPRLRRVRTRDTWV
jgi:hypothetical protein